MAGISVSRLPPQDQRSIRRDKSFTHTLHTLLAHIEEDEARINANIMHLKSMKPTSSNRGSGKPKACQCDAKFMYPSTARTAP
eukprot:4944088-Pyramimonas_sp.AAC.1